MDHRSAVAANALFVAARARVPITESEALLNGLDGESAYDVQNRLVELMVANGDVPAGRKIGLTSIPAQERLGSREPVSGVLFASGAKPNNSTVGLGEITVGKLEAEIGLMLGKDVYRSGQDSHSLSDLVEWVVPAIEIPCSRYERGPRSAAELIADNASSGLYILGSPHSLSGLDLAAYTVSIEHLERTVGRGVGTNCLGSPRFTFEWLIADLSRRGEGMRAGDLILTGSLGPALQLSPGLFRCDFGPLGTVSVTFVPSTTHV